MTAKYGYSYEDLLDMDQEVFELYSFWLVIDGLRERRQQLIIKSMTEKTANKAARDLELQIDSEMYKLGHEPEIGVVGQKKTHKKTSRKKVMAETKKLKEKNKKKEKEK